MASLNTWKEHLETQKGVARYTFSVAKPGSFVVEVRPAGLVIYPSPFVAGTDVPVLKVELDNQPTPDET